MPVRCSTLGPSGAAARNSRFRQRDLNREQRRIHPREHGDLFEPARRPPSRPRSAATACCASCSAGELTTDDRPSALQGWLEVGERVVAPDGCRDRLWDPLAVVGQHVVGRGDDAWRTPVVDFERVPVCPGEVLAELDQVLGRRPRVPVDDLVVVAHTEAAVGRGAQEPDQQHVGRVEVLELVDQEVAATCSGRRSGLRGRTAGSQSTGRSVRRSRRRPPAPEPLDRYRILMRGHGHQGSRPRRSPATSGRAEPPTARRCREGRCRRSPAGGPRTPPR